MNLRQAAQRALKAMEDGEDRADMIEFSEALIALRAALAEPQTTHWEGCEAVHPECKAFAEPEQKPVAWADDVGAVIPHSHKLFVPGLCKNYTRPLYAAPTKWKELTIEDIDAIANVYMEKDRTIRAWGCFAQAIEDKLKEKNT